MVTYTTAIAQTRFGPKKIEKVANTNPKKGLTLRQLRETNARALVSLPNVQNISIRSMKKATFNKNGKKHSGYRFAVKDSTAPKGSAKHYVHETLVFHHRSGLDTALSAQGTNVVVSCDCEFHMYTCEYALTHFQSSFIKHSNGAYPNVTNPGLVPLTCKHVEACLKYIQKNGL